LIKKLEKITNINYITEFTVKEIITNNIKTRESRLEQIWWNKAFWILWEKNWQNISYFWQKIILATWWNWQKHWKTTNSISSTWDWIEIAKKIWAEIDWMQFVKYYPLCLKHNNNPLLHLPMNLLLKWVNVINLKWENILEKHSLLKNCTSDELSRIIFNEESSWEQCFIDFSWTDKKKIEQEFLHTILSLEIEWFNILKDKIPIIPTAYFTVWWIKINRQCKTSITSLFAIWEVSVSWIYWTWNMTWLHITESVVYAKSFVDSV
jgi:L-aspartate oxidase